MKLFLVLIMLFVSTAAFAAEIPECTAKTQGILNCMAGKQCECKYFRPSTMRNDAGGYRWDCGIMRPNCVDPNKISDREDAKPYSGPDTVFIERN